MEQEIDYKEAYKQLQREYEDFTYIISHDLKAPLRAVLNLAVWIEEDLGDNIPEEVSESMFLLKQRVEKMQRMMEAVTQLSRINRYYTEIGKVDVQQILQEVISLIDYPNSIVIEVKGNAPPFYTYQRKIGQVLYELIDNGVRFNDKKEGLITIEISDFSDKLIFLIHDNGIGIPQDCISKVFTVFYTVDPDDNVYGNGTGLSLVKKIVDFIKGKIEITSEKGKGTTVKLIWPKVNMTLSKSD